MLQNGGKQSRIGNDRVQVKRDSTIEIGSGIEDDGDKRKTKDIDQVIAVGILNNPPVTKEYNAINYEAQTYRTDLEPIALVEALYVPFQWGKKNDEMRVIVAYELEGQVVNYSWRADYWAETKKRTIAREMLKTSEIFVRELEKDFHAAREGSVVS